MATTREEVREMNSTSKDLLYLEHGKPSPSSLESTLLVCNNGSLSKTKKQPPPEGRPTIAPLPTSQVLGRVQDFLGVISEANERLKLSTKENCTDDYNIEVLTGKESEYIEMDLMLGVADLNTPEALAAAESAVAGGQAMVSLTGSSSSTESDDSSDEESDSDVEEDEDGDENDAAKSKNCDSNSKSNPRSSEDKSMSKPKAGSQRRKRSKIVVL